MNLANLTAVEAIAAMRNGDIQAEDYAAALVKRANAFADLNAFISYDSDTVIEAGRAADTQRNKGTQLGKLHGLPLTLKDNIDTAQFFTTGGTPGLRHHQPKTDAPVFARLREAGAYCFGKANLNELAFGLTGNNEAYGRTKNPYNPDCIPGGSSGGTGAAVAARMTPVGMGSDTAGSVRIPAALCGVVGFRPSTGRYDQTGVIPISHTRDTIGLVTRSVEDVALLDGVITGDELNPSPIQLQGLRIGVPRNYFFDNLDPEVEGVTAKALYRLAEYGIVLVEVDIPDFGATNAAASTPIAFYESPRDLNKYLVEHGLDLEFADIARTAGNPDVKSVLESLVGEEAVPKTVYQEALTKFRPRLQTIFSNYFQAHEVRAIVFPATPIPAPLMSEDLDLSLKTKGISPFWTIIRNFDPGSTAGLPGLTIPIGLTERGLPVGLAFDGPEGADRDILSIGHALQILEPPMPEPVLQLL